MDMIQGFKIVNNIDDIQMDWLFEYSYLPTRGHNKKLKKQTKKQQQQTNKSIKII